MSSRRPVLLDAVSTRRILRERQQSYFLFNKPRHSKMTSGMEVEDQSPAVQQRVPSTRPIDQRWDRSRGIFFDSVKRRQDFRWSGGNEIVFAAAAERQIKENNESLREVRFDLDRAFVGTTLQGEDVGPVGEACSEEHNGANIATRHPVGDDESGTDAGGLGNFKPTIAQQAPRQSWITTLQSFYNGNRNSDINPPTSDTKPRKGSFNSSIDGDLSISQDLEKLSIHARANDSESTHVETNLATTHDLPLSNEESSEPSPEKHLSDGESSASDESNLMSPSEYSTYQPEAHEPSQDGVSTAISESSTHNGDALEQVDEVHSQGQITYTMSPEDYRSAAIASEATEAAFWSYKLYKNPQGQAPTVHYCTNFETAEKYAKLFLGEAVVGFDLEWEPYLRPSMSVMKRNVSLIQIASDSKIGLFHLALFNGDGVDKLMPPSLRSILESKKIAKVGVNVSGDANRLRTYLGMKPKGLFELSHLYSVVQYSEDEPWRINKRLVSLSRQVQDILLLPLKKDEIRTSAWSKKLNTRQSAYAASDAYAGLQLYHKLEEKRMRMDPTPPRPAFWEANKPLVLGNGRVVVSKPYDPRKKRLAELEAQKGTELDDDEVEEYFDTVENLDTDPVESQDELQLSDESELPTISQPSTKLSQPSDLAEGSEDQEQQPPDLPPSNAKPTQSKHIKRHIPPSPEVKMADLWVTSYRASRPVEYTLKAGYATLRAYHLWHRQGFDCSTIAALLSNPPLAEQTVANYVMTAVQNENLEFDAKRISEPLNLLPKSVVHGRYWKVLRRSG